MSYEIGGTDPAYLGSRNLGPVSLTSRPDRRRAFFDQIRPNPPCTFALLKPDNRPRSSITATSEMQDHVLAGALCVREVIKIYDAAIGHAHKIHGQY